MVVVGREYVYGSEMLVDELSTFGSLTRRSFTTSESRYRVDSAFSSINGAGDSFSRCSTAGDDEDEGMTLDPCCSHHETEFVVRLRGATPTLIHEASMMSYADGLE